MSRASDRVFQQWMRLAYPELQRDTRLVTKANQPPSRRRRLAWGCGGLLAVLALGLVITFFVLNAPRPEGASGADAEALADRVDAALNRDAWEQTGAIQWTFGPTGTRHLWDRERDWARVSWDESEVLVDLSEPTRGVALQAGQRVDDPALIRTAWERWANDSFWLIAPFKLRDGGTTREIVHVDGEDQLLIRYASGGATPGDAYLWNIAPDGTPRAWRMWVSVLPVGGLETRWDGWITLPTGARIATLRTTGPVVMEMGDVMGAAHLFELVPGEDPFAALVR